MSRGKKSGTSSPIVEKGLPVLVGRLARPGLHSNTSVRRRTKERVSSVDRSLSHLARLQRRVEDLDTKTPSRLFQTRNSCPSISVEPVELARVEDEDRQRDELQREVFERLEPNTVLVGVGVRVKGEVL